ncbi:MAG: Chemotaxis regulator - transmits chemoreceptor signals to flagelllar motor component CheY, partial [Chloroflexi bacterium]|nr:Chemotaxis regulator - transmits chemoreceptor signals to flagelllar motor component CheY [Chloroflexota bacterium]
MSGDERVRDTSKRNAGARGQDRLLTTLEQLLALPATDMKSTMDRASDLIGQALGAEKLDVFLYDPTSESLVAMGTSDTPLGKKQHKLGLHRLPLANGGREVEVFQTGQPFFTSHAEADPQLSLGIKQGLGIKSMICVPLEVAGERRGVISADSTKAEHFTEADLRFIEAVSQWVGMVAHRAELVEMSTAAAEEQGRREAAEELVTVLAHDFRNYLTPLLARLDFMRLRSTREGRDRDAQDVELLTQIVRRLQHLIDNLLDATTLEQGIFTLTVQPVDLVELARICAELLRSSTSHITVEGPDELVIEGDPERLQQAIENLITNAVKHGPEGAPVTI